MYSNFFGFRVKPFELTPDSDFLYLSPSMGEIHATLHYGISQRRGFGLLVGEPGTGKTTLINSLIDKSGIDANFAYIFNPDLNYTSLLHTVLVELGLAYVDEDLSKTKAMHRLNKFVSEQFEKNKHTVIVVDEAQLFDIKTLERLRLLSNLETRKQKLIYIIISGQPELENTLNHKSLSQLAQRIGLRCRTKALTEKEAYEYIEHRLKVAEYNGPQLFANKAKQTIWTYSKGMPRTINIICDNCLLTGYGAGLKRIDSYIVKEVIDDLENVPLNNLDSISDISKDSAEEMNHATLDKSEKMLEAEQKISEKLEEKDKVNSDISVDSAEKMNHATSDKSEKMSEAEQKISAKLEERDKFNSDISKNSAEEMNHATSNKSEKMLETEQKISAKLEEKDEESTNIIHKIRKTLIHKNVSELAGQKDRRFTAALITGITGAVIVINIFFVFFLFDSFDNLNNQISVKLEAMRDDIDYHLGPMKEDMPNVKIRTQQQMKKNLENEKAFMQSITGPNSDDKPPADTSSSVSSLDNDNNLAVSGLDVEKVIENNSVAVKKGDTLEKIVIRVYGENNPKIVDALMQINPEIENPDLIFENQIIKLPKKIDLGEIDIFESKKSFQEF